MLGFDPADLGLFSWNDNFNMDDISAQNHFEKVCAYTQNLTVISSTPICFLDTFKLYLNFYGQPFPVIQNGTHGSFST